MSRLKPNQKDILRALKDLGGTATARQIAVKTGLSVNGVVQSLNQSLARRGYVVQDSDYAGGETVWKLVDPPPSDVAVEKEEKPSPQLRMEGL